MFISELQASDAFVLHCVRHVQLLRMSCVYLESRSCRRLRGLQTAATACRLYNTMYHIMHESKTEWLMARSLAAGCRDTDLKVANGMQRLDCSLNQRCCSRSPLQMQRRIIRCNLAVYFVSSVCVILQAHKSALKDLFTDDVSAGPGKVQHPGQ